jgi:hypothetical protein
MKYRLILILMTLAFSVHAKDDPAQMKREIAQHRAIAAAHEAAAKCKEAGTDEEICHAALAKACKGIAIGKLCGMKHSHGE